MTVLFILGRTKKRTLIVRPSGLLVALVSIATALFSDSETRVFRPTVAYEGKARLVFIATESLPS